MASNEFPHLKLTFHGTFKPRFPSRYSPNPEVRTNQDDPVAHAQKLTLSLEQLRKLHANTEQERAQSGQPPIPAGQGFLVRLPEDTDADALAYSLGLELVAETEKGFVLVASKDLEFEKLKKALDRFASRQRGGGSAAALLEIESEQQRIENILDADISWPLNDETVYLFDVSIKTASSTHEIEWPKSRQKKGESEDAYKQRRKELHNQALSAASLEWDEKADERRRELRNFIEYYKGKIITELPYEDGKQTESGMSFPDSVQVRVRMSGAGFKDVIQNFPHIFEVALPPEIEVNPSELTLSIKTKEIVIHPPSADAPAVCVIDSGIQEGHKWLASAMDTNSSRCFLPDIGNENVADEVFPQGHGTRVAGAVLYPSEIPTTGEVHLVAWVQNARVLNKENNLPDNLPPEKYLHETIKHFHGTPHRTKIFNHSINSNVPCRIKRMSAWATKLDQLSHKYDVLFIQSAGNIPRLALQDALKKGADVSSVQFSDEFRIANPAQSLHALTVGSVSANVFDDDFARSFADTVFKPSGFTRTGYGQPWDVIKPDVVEVGGDWIITKQKPYHLRNSPSVSVELLNSTLHDPVATAYSKDGIGTSFAAPKIAHIAAQIQRIFPAASPLLYRALIVNCARWPKWAEEEPDKGKVLRAIGYGVPTVEQAIGNLETRVTLVTADAVMLSNRQLHYYIVHIPKEMQTQLWNTSVRLDVTLAYTATPRRTRARRSGYLETWLDWEVSKEGEGLEDFRMRMETDEKPLDGGSHFPWVIHTRADLGKAKGTKRTNGSLQKDWAVFDASELPDQFAIAVRAHNGWNHREGEGNARYCLVVSFETENTKIPIYEMFRAENEIRVRQEI